MQEAPAEPYVADTAVPASGLARVAGPASDDDGSVGIDGTAEPDADVESIDTGGVVAVEDGSDATPEAVPEASDEPSIDVDALILENRELAAQVETLETETTGLHGELLTLELRVAALSASEALEDGVTDIVIVGDAEEFSDAEESFDDPVETSAGTFLPGAPFASESEPDRSDAGDAAAGRVDVSASSPALVERLVIAETPPGSAAENAGLLPGDVLLSIDSTEVSSFADLQVHDGEPNARLHEIEVLRHGQRLLLVLGETPKALALRTEWFEPQTLGL